MEGGGVFRASMLLSPPVKLVAGLMTEEKIGESLAELILCKEIFASSKRFKSLKREAASVLIKIVAHKQ